VHGRELEVDEVVDERRLHLHRGHAGAVDVEPVGRDPAQPALHVHDADLGRRVGAFDREGQLFTLALDLEPVGELALDLEVARLRQRHGARAGRGRDEQQLARRRVLLVARRHGEQFAFDAFLVVGDDDDVAADVGARDLAQVDGRLRLGHRVAAGLRRHEPAGPRRVGPERAEHRRRQFVEHDAPLRVGLQRRLAQQVGVPVLEDRGLAHRQRRCGGGRCGALGRDERGGQRAQGEAEQRWVHGWFLEQWRHGPWTPTRRSSCQRIVRTSARRPADV
jgi:hypothetical protein